MSISNKLSLSDQLLLAKAVSRLVHDKQPLDRALDQLVSGNHGRLARAGKLLSSRLAQGHSLADALSSTSRRHTQMLSASIEVGQLTGQLDHALDSWTSLRESQLKARRSLLIALAYPLAVLFVTAGSLLFSLQTITPHYREAFLVLTGKIPTWFSIPVWFQEHIWITLLLLLSIAAGIPLAFLMRIRAVSRSGWPRDRSERWLIHAHIARLAGMILETRQGIDRAWSILWKASGHMADALPLYPAERCNDAEAQRWLGKETALAIAAAQSNLLPHDQAQQLLTSIAQQSQQMAEIRAERNANWLPMLVALTAGAAIVLSYVVLIYGPWIELFKSLAHW